MNEKPLYEKILGIVGPWYVEDVAIYLKSGNITIKVAHKMNATFKCPKCNSDSGIHTVRRQRRSTKTLSNARPLPFILIAIPLLSSTRVKSSLVNWHP
jgi:hypothetical protein